MKKSVELTIGELFAGAGGLGLGMILADHPSVKFRPVFAIDNEPNSIKTHATNMRWLVEHAPQILSHAPSAFKRDVEKLDSSALLRWAKLEVGQLGILLGGPPCQGFSTSNRKHKEQSKSKRNRLVKVFFDRLGDLQPKMFLFENVQGVKWTKPTEDMHFTPVQDTIFQDIQMTPSNVQEFAIQRAISLGYRVWFSVLDAVDFGVPQTRARFFLFGVREDLLTMDDTVGLSDLIAAVQSPRVTVSQAILDLPSLENGDQWSGDGYRPANLPFIKSMRQLMNSNDLYDHFTSKHADYVIERYKKIPEGGNWESIRDEMSNYSDVENTHSNIYRRLQSDKPAHTISHYRKSMVIHPTQDRGLSMREACRLQSFPDWFRFQGPLDQQRQQLANAVPPRMASAVAYAIAEFWSQLVVEEQDRHLDELPLELV